MESSEQSIGTHDHWTVWQLVVVLFHILQILAGIVCLSNRPGGQVQDMVSVVGNIRVKFCNTRMGPVLASHGKDMPERVGLCNCAIDI